MKINKIIVFAVMFSLFLLAPIVVSEETSNTFYVDDDGTVEYTSIQDAIDNASDGDTIFVYNGIYEEESFSINKSINLIGEDKENTIILFPLGEDDRKRFEPYKPKKNGSPSYLQSFEKNQNNLQPCTKHSYVMPLPRFDYKINGKVMNSGTELRNTYMASNDSGRLEILNQLYGKNGQKLKRIIDKGLGSLIEALIKPMREFTKFIFGF